MAVVFNETDAKRIQRAVRQVERTPQNGAAQARRHVVYAGRMMLGKADSGISAGASGTVSIYSGFDRADTGRNVTAYALVAITAAKWVSVELIDGVYYAFKIEC